MRPPLKEDPREWQKFATVAALFSALIAGVLWHRGLLPAAGLQAIYLVLAAGLVPALVRPRWFRPCYRAAMTCSHAVGQVVGKVLLALCFLLLLTPLALLLRLQGRDLLQLRRKPGTTSYWHPARPNESLDRAY
jgi:hypothetical protein